MRCSGRAGAAAALLPGYEARPGQLAMAERIAEAIDGDERLLVEAGTGTGKTLAYLVPALLSGRKVVVSTGTKTLQDQIAADDLPRLRAMFDRAGLLPAPLEWAVMKGLSNYLCRRRLGERDSAAIARSREPELDRLLAFAASSPTGDRADLADLADDAPLWGDVAATPETRIGPRCPYFERCFVTAMRRRAAAAPLIIVNHHLFFADLALRARWPEAQVLPPYEAVIFDEAHQIEDVATEFFGVHASTQRLFALARDLGRETGVDAHRRAGGRRAGSRPPTDALRGRAARPGCPRRAPASRRRASRSRARLTAGPRARALPRPRRVPRADRRLAASRRRRGRQLAAPDRARAAWRAARPRCAPISALLVAGRGRDHVRWLAASPRNVGLHASPVDVSPVLGRALDGCPGPIVLTSATLTVAGSFDYLRARLGLGDTASDATFPSPFRYDRQALLYLAPDLPDPNHDGFPAAAAARMAELCAVTAGRALLLFTSFRNMRIAEAHLRAGAAVPAAGAGRAPAPPAAASMRERVGSVLLATQSFWEGVDVPGEALSLVVMDKMPFAVPDDPLTAARIDRIRDDGGEPFNDYQLPRAALALKQGFGRLIRTRTDRGIVAVLDGRVARKSYGATLIASLPPDCPRTESLEDVAAFWTRVHPAGAARPPRRRHEPLRCCARPPTWRDRSRSGRCSRALKGIDLRQVGSGNIGATNVARAMGKGWAVAVLAADACKGFVPRVARTPLRPVGDGDRAGRRGRDRRAHVHACSCAAAAARGSRRRWASRWRCRRSRRWSVSSPTPWSSRPRACRRWDRCWASGRSRCCSCCASSPPRPLMVLALGGAVLVTLRHRENIARLVRGEEKRT